MTPRKPRQPRIRPANLRQLPSVLDTKQASAVLRISVERVRKLTNDGRIRRLTYTRAYLYDADEIRRVIRTATAEAADVESGPRDNV